MKKMKMAFLGLATLLFALTLNFKNAFNDYGVTKSKLHVEILAQTNTNTTGGDTTGGDTTGGDTTGGDTTGGDTTGGDSNCGCRSPQFFYGSCNQRMESITSDCYVETVNRTYVDANGTICGSAVIVNGVIQSSVGILAGIYSDVTSSQTYSATRVNCPTDGNTNQCEEYNPCF